MRVAIVLTVFSTFGLAACIAAVDRNYVADLAVDDGGADTGSLGSDTGTGDDGSSVVDANTTTDTGPQAKYTVGGVLTGLTGTGLVLQNNGGDDLSLTANGAFTFSSKAANGDLYAVTVKTPPSNPTQGCAVAGATGTVETGNVTSITVACSTEKFKVGGTLSGLPPGENVVLQNNAGDNLPLNQNGPFAFSTTVLSGASYSITVLSGPTRYNCVPANASGLVGAADVTEITVACTIKSFTIGGTASGITGAGLKLLNQTNAEEIAVGVNGVFTFPTKVPSLGSYNVRVSANPSSRFCELLNGSGTMDLSNVTAMVATCYPYTENFDGVTVPALPLGWVAAISGAGAGNSEAWKTVAGNSQTAPNHAFAPNHSEVTDNTLTSLAYPIQGTAATLSFRHRYGFEMDNPNSFYDGGVLEVSVNGGAFTDIVTAGGVFAGGTGYNAVLSTCCSNPLGARAAWGGQSAGYPAYVTSTVTLPASFAGKTARFRWRLGTDIVVPSLGWDIDSVVVTP